MSERLSSRIDGYLTESFKKYATTERNLIWEMNTALTPEGPQVLIQTFLPGLILGTFAQTFVGLQDPLNFTQEQSDDLVQEIVQALRKIKDSQADEAIAEVEATIEQGSYL